MNTVKVERLYLKTFLITLGAAALIFLPAMIYDQGYFLFVGDFNSQQIPFYMNVHDSIRAGEWGWNWYTDLGANMIGSYTFYLLGSPFFYLTIPLPSSWVPYTLGPLLMLKMACCALFACVYLKRYVKHEIFAMLGGMLYAFSGFSIYNIFFNHFHEAIVFFPLMLYALDEWMENGRRGLFALTVCLNALINYFFFFGEVVFVIIYYFVRLFSGGYEKSWRKFWGIAMEAVIGFMMSFVLMVPSALSVLQNSRVSKFPSGFAVWLYSSKERLPAIINSFLFPPELPSKQVFLPDANTKWTSLSAYLPIVSCTGAIVYMQNRRRDWLSRLMRTLLVMALIPGLNALFVAFNASYYARWFYMFVLILILATIISMDNGLEKGYQRVSWQVLAVTLAIVMALALTPQMQDGKISRIGLYDEEYWPYFIAVAASAIFGMLVFILLQTGMRNEPKAFAKRMMIAVCIFSVLYGNFFVYWGKTRSYDTKNYLIPDAIQGEEKITIPDKDEVIRIDADDTLINMGMFWKISCMRAFHSVVPGSIMDFYKYIGEKRDVSSKIPEEQYAVRGLLSVHWYFDRINMSSNFGDPGSTETLMPGYTYYDTMAGYRVWENDYYVPMGFTYDQYILDTDLDLVTDSSKAAMMLHAVRLNPQQVFKYQNMLTRFSPEEGFRATKYSYFEDCLKHREETVENVVRTKNGGITCESHFDTDEFVFFSIPWDEGWSCFIDGAETQIEKVNVGFMAIVVPSGDHVIEFKYETPGLKIGFLASLIGTVLLGIYYYFACKCDKKRKEKEERLIALKDKALALGEIIVDTSDTSDEDESEAEPSEEEVSEAKDE